jgi:ComF family protein
MLTTLAALIWPPTCASCDEAVETEPFCALCTESLLPAPPLGGVQAGGLFGGPLAEAIQSLKYCDRPALARPLGEWLAGRVTLPAQVRVVSVPLGRRRLIERGYDQAMLLADALAAAAGRARLRGVVRRVRETPPQVGRDRAQRRANVAGAFAADGAVRGLDLVLLDDVITTGATADACRVALERAGACSVQVVALARTEG